MNYTTDRRFAIVLGHYVFYSLNPLDKWTEYRLGRLSSYFDPGPGTFALHRPQFTKARCVYDALAEKYGVAPFDTEVTDPAIPVWVAQ